VVETALAFGAVRSVGEEQVRAERRAVVLGVPGAGKSRLLERLATTPQAGERAVLVRLRDVRTTVGTPAHLFGSTAASVG